jgi:hypothetical protein
MASVLETVGPRTGSAPLTYLLAEAGTVDVMSLFAAFDGTNAASSFRPVVTVRSQSGAILARSFPAETVAAGDSADVTFAPFLGRQAAAAGAVETTDGVTTVSPTDTLSIGAGLTLTEPTTGTARIVATGAAGTVLNYTEFTVTVTVTSTNEAAPTTIVTASAAVTLNGTTRIGVTFYTPVFATGTGASALLANLWRDTTDLGRMVGSSISGTGIAANATRYLTPAAGTYTFSIRGWRTNNDGTVVAGNGGAGAYLPGYILIATA